MGRSNEAWQVRLSTGIWESAWFDGLPDDKYKLVWLYLCAPRNATKCGIFELNKRLISRLLRVSPGKLERILGEFVANRRVELQNTEIAPETTYILVRNFTEGQHFGGDARTGVAKELKELGRLVPKLVQVWLDDHPGYTDGLLEGDLSPPQAPRKAKRRRGQGRPKGEPGTGTENRNIEQEQEHSAKAVEGSEDVPPDAADELARRICDHLDKLRAEGYEVKNPRTPAAMAAFIRKSGVSPNLIHAAWPAAWEHGGDYWRNRILNMASWTTGGLFKDLVNWKLNRQRQRAQSGENEEETSRVEEWLQHKREEDARAEERARHAVPMPEEFRPKGTNHEETDETTGQ